MGFHGVGSVDQWHTLSCDAPATCLCEAPVGPPQPPTPPRAVYVAPPPLPAPPPRRAELGCPLVYNARRLSWADSEAHCQSLGSRAHLATIASAGVARYVDSMFVRPQGACRAAWIGFTDSEREGATSCPYVYPLVAACLQPFACSLSPAVVARCVARSEHAKCRLKLAACRCAIDASWHGVPMAAQERGNGPMARTRASPIGGAVSPTTWVAVQARTVQVLGSTVSVRGTTNCPCSPPSLSALPLSARTSCPRLGRRCHRRSHMLPLALGLLFCGLCLFACVPPLSFRHCTLSLFAILSDGFNGVDNKWVDSGCGPSAYEYRARASICQTRPIEEGECMASALAPPSATRCGPSWVGNGALYQLAQSGAASCDGCGRPILDYSECSTAARSGASKLQIRPLGAAEVWGGPPGCHIQDHQNFQYNLNLRGGGAAQGHTPVCKSDDIARSPPPPPRTGTAAHPLPRASPPMPPLPSGCNAAAMPDLGVLGRAAERQALDCFCLVPQIFDGDCSLDLDGNPESWDNTCPPPIVAACAPSRPTRSPRPQACVYAHCPRLPPAVPMCDYIACVCACVCADPPVCLSGSCRAFGREYSVGTGWSNAQYNSFLIDNLGCDDLAGEEGGSDDSHDDPVDDDPADATVGMREQVARLRAERDGLAASLGQATHRQTEHDGSSASAAWVLFALVGACNLGLLAFLFSKRRLLIAATPPGRTRTHVVNTLTGVGLAAADSAAAQRPYMASDPMSPLSVTPYVATAEAVDPTVVIATPVTLAQ